ncbi:hypothetical protein [Blastopirellula marina]|uniref:Uncharacterized protein n=1 Tax=Blastopirellula marina DSM 3645 TaxID=314230 RepID=A3ZZR3_9BACT|nr:hypothetical protein [Blastopirellula marina]EAQ78012.1 hypothetical protein DSM3645_16230 [Blastopirellula marina DSM 3645]
MSDEPHIPTFQCPGQAAPIDRATHLSRLTQFFPGCRNCPQREDQAGLPARIIQKWSEIPPKPPLEQQFHHEGLSADLFDEFSVDDAAQLAAAFCWGQKSVSRAPLLLGMAHQAAIDQAEAIIAAWRRAGIAVELLVDATTALTAWTIDQRKLAGGILLSSPLGDLRRIEVSLFGPGGAPIAGDPLEKIKRRLQPHDRLPPARRRGSLTEIEMSSPYLQRFAPLHRALRPLRLVVQSPARGSVNLLRQLIARSVCELFVLPSGGDPGARLAAAIQRHQAHFGVWIDGNGETIEVFEERGYRVLQPQLTKLLIDEVAIWEPEPLRIASPTPLDLPSEATLVRCSAGRGEMASAIRLHDCQFGVEPSGRYWWRNQLPAADALGVVTLLLTRQSRIDRSLSSQLI